MLLFLFLLKYLIFMIKKGMSPPSVAQKLIPVFLALKEPDEVLAHPPVRVVHHQQDGRSPLTAGGIIYEVMLQKKQHYPVDGRSSRRPAGR
jgi:hypothetical protein